MAGSVVPHGTQGLRQCVFFLAPVIQYGKYGCALTLEQLGRRWGWGKTKVWRFFQKNSTTFGLQKLPGSYGCLIFNLLYDSHKGDSMPSEGKILFLLDAIRKASRKGIEAKSDSERINKMIAWNSKSVMKQLQHEKEEDACCRVSVSDTYTRAYFLMVGTVSIVGIVYMSAEVCS